MTTEPFRANDRTDDWAATPGVIPYVEFHTGPRRLLTIDLTLHVSAHLDGEVFGRAPASFILPPGEGRAFLTYSTLGGSGSLTHSSPPVPRA